MKSFCAALFFLLINVSYASDNFNASDNWKIRSVPAPPANDMEEVAVKTAIVRNSVIEGKIRGSFDQKSGANIIVTVDREQDDAADAHEMIRYKVCKRMICAETAIRYYVEASKADLELENERYEAAMMVASGNHKYGPVIINGRPYKVVFVDKCTATVVEISDNNNQAGNAARINTCTQRNVNATNSR